MMITRILLLLLYFNLCSCEPKYKIDFSRCTEDMRCFVRESCTLPQSTPPSLKNLVKYAKIAPLPDCDAIIQIKAYTSKKYLIMVQVNAAKDIKPDGVSFNQGADGDQDAMQFKCAKDSVEVNKAFEKTKHTSTLDGKNLFCAFFFETKDKNKEISKIFEDDDPSNTILNDNKPNLMFETDAVHKIEYKNDGASFWYAAYNTENCDPDRMKSTTGADDTYMIHEMDATLLPPLKCDPPMDLRISIDGGETIIDSKGRQIFCERKQWKYYDEASDRNIRISNTFTANCVEKLCTLCSPLPALACGSACSTPQLHNDADICHSYDCPATKNVWQLDGGKEVSGELECKKDPSTSSPAWFFKDGTTHPDKVDKGSCSNKEMCWTAAAFVEDCPPEPEKIPVGMECVKTLIKANRNSELSCPEGQVLRWFAPPTDEIKPDVTKITCDFATSTFKDSRNTEVAAKSRVVCLQNKTVEKMAEPAAAGMKMEVIYGAGGGLVLLVIVGVIVVVVVMRRKKEEDRKHKLPRTLGESLHSIEAPSQQSVAQPAPEEPKSEGVAPVLPKAAKGPWRMRDKQGEETWTKVLKEDFFMKHFSEKAFITNCLADFNVLRQESRKEVFHYTFSLAPYAKEEENKYPFGSLRHAFELVKRLQVCQHDSHLNMCRAWRFVKLIGHLIMKKLKDKTQAKLLAKRVRMIMAAWARPILTDLGWKAQPNEDRKDAELRWWAVRVLVWAGGEQDVMTELKRQSELPYDQLESPMRSIVFGYAVRFLGQHETLQAKYWGIVRENPKDPKRDEYGTMRQHLLFALAMARGSKTCREVDFWENHSEAGEASDENLRLIFEPIYDFDPTKKEHFTPQDLLWAVQGAAEHSGNANAAIQVHTEQLEKMRKEMNAKAEAAKMDLQLSYTLCPLYMQLKANCPKKDTAFRSSFLQAFADTNEVLAECCEVPDQFVKLSDAAYYLEQRLHLGWDKELTVQEHGHNHKMYEKRVHCQEDLFKNPKVVDILSDAIKCCE